MVSKKNVEFLSDALTLARPRLVAEIVINDYEKPTR